MTEAANGTSSQRAQGTTGMQALGIGVLAIALYALLADAAIETFASGSPLRWWVAGSVALYAGATALLWQRVPRFWQRFGLRGQAGSSFFVLLGLLALTAWLPQGHAAGIVLLTLHTSTVFAAVGALTVLLAAVVLLRALKSTRIWVRGALAVLVLYAVVAFALGIARGTPYSQLLSGSSPWARLPFWLQGAFLGIFVVVPAAVVAELARLVRHILARIAWSSELLRVVMLVLSVAMAIPGVTPSAATGVAAAGGHQRFTFADERQLQQAAAQRLVDEPPATPQNVDSAKLLEKVGAAVRGFRQEEWEVGAVAASLGNDPAAAFAFVRDGIAFDPYPGVLRGAEGTLAARAGNAWDRALLLRALIARSGLETRLAFTTLDKETAARLVTRACQRPSRRLPGAAPAGLLARVVTTIAARAQRDDAALRLALGSRFGELGVDDSELVLQDAARHAWVQIRKGNAWIDLDPTLPEGEMGRALAGASGTAETIPAEQQHVVVVRVVSESLAGSSLNATVSLEQELPAAAAARQYVLLGFEPNGGSPSSFVPTLYVAGQAHAGRPIAAIGGGGPAGFGSLFGGGGNVSSGELTGLFIDVETRVPGRRPAIARHVLLDRVPWEARSGSGVRADALEPPGSGRGVPGAFLGFHHVLISTGGSSSLEMARLRQSAIEAATRTAAEAPRPGRASQSVSLLWAADLTLVEGSERLVVQAIDAAERGRVYVDQPRVFLGSWFPGAGDEKVSRETDLLIDSVRILRPEPASAAERAARQLQYGALQSALETESGLQLAAAWNPAGRQVVTTSLATGGSLTVLTPADVQRLPARTAASLRQALRAGDLAVVPGNVATAAVWWTVSRSGFARAIMDPGAGASLIDGLPLSSSDLVLPVDPPSETASSGGRGGGSGGYIGLTKKQATTAIKATKKLQTPVRDVFTRTIGRLDPARFGNKLGG